MIELQALNKVLVNGDLSFLLNNDITKDYFPIYTNEFLFIQDHFDKYHKAPDTLTFLKKFPDFEIVDVKEPNTYIIDKLRENKLYNDTVPILQKAAELYNQDANKAVEYINSQFKDVRYNTTSPGTDIVKHANIRLQELEEKRANPESWFFKSGFDELDQVINGIQRGEEFLVLFARTNQGKSWIGEKMAISVWEQGYNVGFFSPEMSATSIGYRFDTLYKNFANDVLVTGRSSGDYDKYQDYIGKLSKKKNKFLVASPKTFNKDATVSKLRNWIINNNLDMVVIDGLSYLNDERYRRGDNITTSLTNISEDLMELSVELGVPVIGVVQANREAIDKDHPGPPKLENIRGSDGIAHNASKVISIRNKKNTLELVIHKQRTGLVGNKLLYAWDINNGEFIYIPNPDSGIDNDNVIVEDLKEKLNEMEDIF